MMLYGLHFQPRPDTILILNLKMFMVTDHTQFANQELLTI